MRNSANSIANRAYVVVMRTPDEDGTSDLDEKPEESSSADRLRRRMSLFTSTMASLDDAETNRPAIVYEATLFSALHDIIDSMKSAPAGFTEAVDHETAFDAERVLGFIESSGVPAPKIFSHGGDAVVFTWDGDKTSRYLTISGGDAAFLDVNKRSYIQCPYPIVPLDSPDALPLLRLLGSSRVAKNAVE